MLYHAAHFGHISDNMIWTRTWFIEQIYENDQCACWPKFTWLQLYIFMQIKFIPACDQPFVKLMRSVQNVYWTYTTYIAQTWNSEVEENEVDQNGPHFKNEYLFSTTINRLIAPHLSFSVSPWNVINYTNFSLHANGYYIIEMMTFYHLINLWNARHSVKEKQKTVMKFANREIM